MVYEGDEHEHKLKGVRCQEIGELRTKGKVGYGREIKGNVRLNQDNEWACGRA